MQMQPQRHRGTEALPAKVGLCASMPLWLIIFGIILIGNNLLLAQNDRAVERALTYLAKTQNADGSFGTAKDMDQQTIATSVSLLAFISAGHAPDLGKFGSVVRAATDRLIQWNQKKMSDSSHEACLASLGEVAGIDDNPQDQIQLGQLLGGGTNDPKIIPFTGNLAAGAKTLLVLRADNPSHASDFLSYSALYRAAVFSSRLHVDELTQRIDALVVSREQTDGSWDDDPELTAYAVLALTAGDHLMPLAP
jgi:hypothetical protein